MLYERVDVRRRWTRTSEEYEALVAIAEGDDDLRRGRPRRPSPPPPASTRGDLEPRLSRDCRVGRRRPADCTGDRPHRHDVLVIGGGPAGAAAGHWLARAGPRRRGRREEDVPREKTCGDGLTPRAVTQLAGHGPRGEDRRQPPPLRRPALHRPRHHPRAAVARAPGAPEPRLRRAPARPRHDGGRGGRGPRRHAPAGHRGAAADPARRAARRRGGEGQGERARSASSTPATSSSPTGRSRASAGPSATSATSALPQGMAIRGYFESPLHADPWIESALDVRDRNGDAMPGYGWIFPCGDGTINVGIGLLSTFRGWREINTSHLMQEWAATAPDALGDRPRRDARRGHRRAPADGAARSTRSPGRPGSRSATPPARSTRSTARASTTPTRPGAWRPSSSTRRSSTGSAMPLARYPDLLEAEYGLYFRVARAFAHVIGQPALMQQLTRVGDAVASAHGVGAADHGQPPAPRRARPGRGRLQGRRRHRPARAERIPASRPALACAEVEPPLGSGRTCAAADSSVLGVEGDLALGGGGPDAAASRRAGRRSGGGTSTCRRRRGGTCRRGPGPGRCRPAAVSHSA